MARPALVIDARPRGPEGPIALALVQGRPVLAHLVELANTLDEVAVAVHARPDEQASFGAVLDRRSDRFLFRTGPPPEGAAILRADRVYDAARLRKTLRRGGDPEQAVVWRLDGAPALRAVDDELNRRATYQPLGSYWAIGPARFLAQRLCPTHIRPNAVTLASASLMMAGSATLVLAPATLPIRLAIAGAFALALVLDTADGHLARLQGTTSDFGRWLDSTLDEWSDMALHAAIAWSAYARDGRPEWLAVGIAYAMGKYLYMVGVRAWEPAEESEAPNQAAVPSGLARWLVRAMGHADLRWHAWILLAAVGRLDVALAVYAVYFPLRAAAGLVGKGVRHA
ncbi:CDP-alcohol phosphatidyltransferase family protein [Isosphaeraceae bacterium EP7]